MSNFDNKNQNIIYTIKYERIIHINYVNLLLGNKKGLLYARYI